MGEVEDPVYTYLTSHYEGDERYNLIETYAVSKITCCPTMEESQTIVTMLEAGVSMEDAIDIYQFWLTTNAPISTLTDMANALPEEKTNTTYWTEDVYNQVTGNTDVLTEEQISDYLDDEIIPDDIIAANVLSRKQVYTVSEILNKRKSGKTWIQLVADVYDRLGVSFSLRTEDFTHYAQIGGMELLQTIVFAPKSDHDIIYWLDLLADNAEQFYSEKSAYQTQRFRQEMDRLRTAGIYRTPAVKEDVEQEEYIEAQLQSLGVSNEEVTALKAEGYEALEILNAAETADVTGRSVMQQLNLQ